MGALREKMDTMVCRQTIAQHEIDRQKNSPFNPR